MYLMRYKAYSPNFGLYKVITVHKEDRIMDSSGRTLPEEIRKGVIVRVTELSFCGSAKSKTGKHDLRADNTEVIYAEDLKKVDGKYNVHKWALLNQEEIDALYRQRVVSNI